MAKKRAATAEGKKPAKKGKTEAGEAAPAAKKHPRVQRMEEQFEKQRAKGSKAEDAGGEAGGGAAAAAAADDGDDVIGRPEKKSPRWTNRQRTLVFSSRGVSYRARHLMDDMRLLMPHTKKDAKIDRKDRLSAIVPEICEMKNCNNCIYFEMRKKQDLYAWVGKMPHGPSVKFLVQNIHTMDELKMTGNALKGSRPVLNFDANFDTRPELKLMKEVLFQAFGTPRAHPKSKPFVDRMMSFFWLDERVWVRNYQIAWSEDKASPDDHELVEIGPRFVMQPIRIFHGPFGGKTLYENEEYISPNEFRRNMKSKAAQKFLDRQAEKQKTEEKKRTTEVPEDELDTVFQDAAANAQ